MGDVIIKANACCRFGNFLFWIFSNKDYNISSDVIKSIEPWDKSVFVNLRRLGVNIEADDSIQFDWDYKQDQSLFDFDKIRNDIKIPEDVRTKIYETIPDIEDRLMINVRRGDYLNYQDRFIILSKEYIETVYKKYYDGMKVLIISDDADWCKDNLTDLFDDVVVHHFDDILCDFFAISLSKAVICSCSSFSIFGTYLNKSNDCVVPHPYYKDLDDERLVPYFAKREECTEEMLYVHKIEKPD